MHSTVHDVCIGVVSHKPYAMPTDTAYVPIWVGERSAMPQGFTFHGDGDGIADKNEAYCELTGLYWVWKNSDAAIKGLAHYRRILARRRTKSLDDVLGADEIKRLLADADALVPAKQLYPWTTIEKHYINSKKGYEQIHSDDMTALREAMRQIHPSFSAALDETLEGRGCHLLNIMTMRADLFDEYCSWLFPLLQRFVELRSSRTDRRRFAGNVSEFLLDPWMATRKVTYREVHLYEPEPSPVKYLSDFVLRRPCSGVVGGPR